MFDTTRDRLARDIADALAAKIIYRDDCEQVGSLRWDGDEFFDFRYMRTRERLPDGCIPVFVRAEDADGAVYTETREDT